jgi:hypothetical protein
MERAPALILEERRLLLTDCEREERRGYIECHVILLSVRDAGSMVVSDRERSAKPDICDWR